MNEITVQENQQIVDYKAKATEWLQNMGTALPPQQTVQFLELCQAYKLNPFKREIYAVSYKDKFNIIVGYEVYLKRAERTGKLNGWQCVANDDGTKARVTINRKDWSNPFIHEVFMNEVRQNSPIWQKMPIFMMKKVCIEQGFRMCFPDEMGGMPYGEEEVSYDEKVIQPEEPKQEFKSANLTVEQNGDEREFKRLSQLVNRYEKELSSAKQKPTPYDRCCKALAENDTAKISEMLNRCIDYLGKKGIKVA